MTITRRTFFAKTSALVLGAASIPELALGQSPSKFALMTTHEQAAQQARQLAQNRKVQLTILYPQGALGNIKPAGELFSQLSGISMNYLEASLDEINTRITLSAMAQNAEFDLALPATFGLPDLIEAKWRS